MAASRARWRYAAFGQRLGANRRIPDLLAAPEGEDPAEPGIDVRFGSGPRAVRPAAPAVLRYASDERTATGQPALELWHRGGGACWELRYADGATFVFDRAGTCVEVSWRPPLTYRGVLSYFLGPVMGLLLRLRGLACLHASAVAIHGRAVLFVGSSEAGKTTTAAGLARLGYPVLTDDVAPLLRGESDGGPGAGPGVGLGGGAGWMVAPGYPRLRLRATSFEAVAGVPSRSPLEPFDGARYYLDLTRDGYRFQATPLPLGAIYLLGERTDHPEAPCFSTVPAATGLMALIGETFATRVLDTDMRAAEFETLSQVVAAIPPRRVHAHVDPNRLAHLCEAIVADCATRWSPA